MWTELEVDLYSGRANPQVTLAPAEAAEIDARLRELGPLARVTPPSPGLGYRGVRVVRTTGAAAARLEVFGGAVAVVDGPDARPRLADVDRRFELWLLSVAVRHLEPGDREAVGEVIAQLAPR